jgi:hypothetical protein
MVSRIRTQTPEQYRKTPICIQVGHKTGRSGSGLLIRNSAAFRAVRNRSHSETLRTNWAATRICSSSVASRFACPLSARGPVPVPMLRIGARDAAMDTRPQQPSLAARSQTTQLDCVWVFQERSSHVSGFRARMEALMNLPSAAFAIFSRSSWPARIVCASAAV